MEARLGIRDFATAQALSRVLAGLLILVVLLQGVPAAVDAYTSPRRGAGDFYYLLSAGKLAVSDDSGLLYGPIPPDKNAWAAEHGYGFPTIYPYAPAAAYATASLTLLSDTGALGLTRVLIGLIALGLALLVASAFRSWYWRIALAGAVFCWEPILLNVRIGQFGVFVAGAIALGTLVFLRNRTLGAIILAFVAVKPSAVVGPALVVLPEKARLVATFLATAAVVVAVPFLWLGASAFYDWLEILSSRGAANLQGAEVYNQGLNSLLGRTEVVSLALLAALIAATLLTDAVNTRLGLKAGIGFALLLGCLLNPHSLLYDWGVAWVGLYFLRRSLLFKEDREDLIFGVAAITLFAAGQLAWDLRVEQFVVRPLTGWAIATIAALIYLAWRAPKQTLDIEYPGEAASV